MPDAGDLGAEEGGGVCLMHLIKTNNVLGNWLGSWHLHRPPRTRKGLDKMCGHCCRCCGLFARWAAGWGCSISIILQNI